jgi:hypothetical protein
VIIRSGRLTIAAVLLSTGQSATASSLVLHTLTLEHSRLGHRIAVIDGCTVLYCTLLCSIERRSGGWTPASAYLTLADFELHCPGPLPEHLQCTDGVCSDTFTSDRHRSAAVDAV